MASDVNTVRPDLHERLGRYAFVAAFVSCLGQVTSIFIAHTALIAACAGLFASRGRVRMPPIAVPLVGFALWTALSLAFSDDPAAGLPQVRKLFVFLVLPVVYSLFHTMSRIQRLLEAMIVATLAGGVTAIGQFAWKAAEAYATGVSFYDSYFGRRITGFFSHWMTFSQVLLMIALMLASYLLFYRSRRPARGVWIGTGVVLGLALILSGTRSVWAAALLGGVCLVWHWKPRLLWVAPIGLLLLMVAAPGPVKQRVQSVTEPGSYENRFLMWRTGAQMMQAHPWFGVGPERVGARFDEFQPEAGQKRPSGYYAHLHNVVIHYAAERGIPAAIFIVWLLVKVLADHVSAARRCGRSDDPRSWVFHGVAAATLGLMGAGMLDQSLGDSEVLGTYLVLVALGYRAMALGAGNSPVEAG
jgi:putative inorganic carbon (HCO3(-)) transporter